MIKSDTFDGFELELRSDFLSLKQEWLVLQKEQTATTYQGYEWIKAAFETIDKNHTPVILYVHKDSKPVFILPLCLEAGFPCKLRWAGQNHVNIGGGLFARSYLENQSEGLIRHAFKFIGKSLEKTAILHLKNQMNEIDGYPNPLLFSRHEVGPNPLYKIDIRVGFEPLLDLLNGKRKRKLFRHQSRVAETLGGVELVIPKDKNEIEVALDVFFKLKADRLRELGVRGVFEGEGTQSFFRQKALQPEVDGWQPLRLYVLKVGGKIRALYGVGVAGNACNAAINAVSYDDFADESPGEMIMYMMLRDLTERGFEYFDIGIGLERYKTSWCKQPMSMYETIYPLTAGAMLFGMYLRHQTRLKQQIKSNGYLWEQVKKVRKFGNDLFASRAP